MSDDRSDAADDGSMVDINESGDLYDWVRRLSVSEEDLRRAVAAVGTSATAVRDHLGKPSI